MTCVDCEHQELPYAMMYSDAGCHGAALLICYVEHQRILVALLIAVCGGLRHR